jgi:C-5 cytosine-specific DNA methylase
VIWDARNNLFLEVLRAAWELRPRCIIIENVPGLANLAGGAFLGAILQGLDDLGYAAACAELPGSSPVRTGAACPARCFPPACSVPCAKTTLAATGE